MKTLSIIILVFLLASLGLTSCGPANKLRRAQRLIEKAELEGAVWGVDTVTVEVPVITTETKLDTIILIKPGDTVTLVKDRLQVKYVRLPGDSVFIEGKCKSDTIYKSVPVTITKTIVAPKGKLRWWHILAAFAAGVLLGRLVLKLLV